MDKSQVIFCVKIIHNSTYKKLSTVDKEIKKLYFVDKFNGYKFFGYPQFYVFDHRVWLNVTL